MTKKQTLEQAATANPAREAVMAALSSTHSILIAGTQTRVRSVAPLDDQRDYGWVIRWLSESGIANRLPVEREIVFNRYCAWTVVAP